MAFQRDAVVVSVGFFSGVCTLIVSMVEQYNENKERLKHKKQYSLGIPEITLDNEKRQNDYLAYMRGEKEKT